MFFKKKIEEEDKVFKELKLLLQILEVKVAKVSAEVEMVNLKLRSRFYKNPPPASKEEEELEEVGLLTEQGKPYKAPKRE